jgi:hypothetical protein
MLNSKEIAHGFGAELTLGFIISHANGIKINPKGRIDPDVSGETDLAAAVTSDVHPCGGSLGDPAGDVVTVLDE